MQDFVLTRIMDCAKATRRGAGGGGDGGGHAGLSEWSRFILAEPLWLGSPFKLLLKVTGSSVKKARNRVYKKKKEKKKPKQTTIFFLPKNNNSD